VEALKLAIKLLKKGTDVARYKFAVSVLQKIAPNDPDATLDQEWADRTARKVQAETEKIEAALKSYKHNLIKESIRVCEAVFFFFFTLDCVSGPWPFADT
jgi:COP9 signalosome complex subunit 1